MPPVWCPPIPEAPAQGMVMSHDTIDKYDIIGFAALLIVDVISVHEASGTAPDARALHRLRTQLGHHVRHHLPGLGHHLHWLGTRSNGNPTGGTCGPFTTTTSFGAGTPHTWRSLGGTGSGCPGNNDVLNVGHGSRPDDHVLSDDDVRPLWTAAREQQCRMSHHGVARLHPIRRLQRTPGQHQGREALRSGRVPASTSRDPGCRAPFIRDPGG